MDSIPTDFIKVLGWLVTTPVLGAILSALAERLNAFQNLSPDLKRLIIILCSVGITVGAELLKQLPPEVLEVINQYWPAVAIAITTYLVTQVYHKVMHK